ncbi:MAG: DUF6788 family protein [Dermatophilaceae bacterium]
MAGKQDPDQFPRMLRGTLITMRRKCGKPTCRCAQGRLHEGPALSVSLSGKSITISLRPADVPAVQAALERYRVKQEILQEQASWGVATLRARNARR